MGAPQPAVSWEKSLHNHQESRVTVETTGATALHDRNGETMSIQLFSLEGKVAVVTGGTSGIGHAMSLGLAEAGA